MCPRTIMRRASNKMDPSSENLFSVIKIVVKNTWAFILINCVA